MFFFVFVSPVFFDRFLLVVFIFFVCSIGFSFFCFPRDSQGFLCLSFFKHTFSLSRGHLENIQGFWKSKSCFRMLSHSSSG